MQELGRTRLTASGDTITVDFADKPNKKFLKIICALKSVTDVTNANLTFNNDTATNYAKRTSENGGADATLDSDDAITNIPLLPTSRNLPKFIIIDVENFKTQEKLVNASSVDQGTAGAANAPNRVEGAHKWANTTDFITRVDIVNSGAGDYDVGSEVIVLGSNFPDGEDFDDNFWKELGRKELDAVGDTITINPIQTKKYLKVVKTLIPSGTIGDEMSFNNDTGTNYARRRQANGGTDATAVSEAAIKNVQTASGLMFTVTYILNLANQEKLVIMESMNATTAGAANAPNRDELAAKWSNTTDLISRIDNTNAGGGDYAKGSEMIIYGSD